MVVCCLPSINGTQSIDRVATRLLEPALAALLGCFIVVWGQASADEWSLERVERGVVVKLDGQLVTEYLADARDKPALWPLVGPTGKPITRAFPIAEVAGEEIDQQQRDHFHHLSFWFALGKVNGYNFWDSAAGHGVIRQTRLLEASGGQQGTIVTQNDWLAPDGKKQLSDERKFVFRAGKDQRIIDVNVRLMADAGAVSFGDTKEGSLALRVARSMRADSQPSGEVINSAGDTNAKAFGKRAEWVDFHGPVDSETVGVALLTHPKSFHAPSRWFVRPYGLMAVSPFGGRELGGEEDASYTLPAGESLTIRCRVILHRGDEKSADIAGAYSAYAREE
jgi:hypothetical protein